jgi:uncharacterized membrane protein SpoIIM required for sporulation
VTEQAQLRAWLLGRAPRWQRLHDSFKRLQYRRHTSVDESIEVLEGYRALARDLATARQSLPGSGIAAALESVYASFHSLVHRPARNTRASLLRVLRVEIPGIVRSLRPQIGFVVALFVVSIGAGWWLINTFPTLIALIASEDMIDHVERGELWTSGLLNVAPSSLLSVRIFSNNIVVSSMAFCAGALYGLGTFYMVALNGLMLGGIFAFTHQHGLDGRLFSFIIAHGTVELSVICLAGAAGMALGEALIRPEHGNRREALERCAARMGRLLGLCAVFLVGCGFIEGFISPDPAYPLASRIVIGSLYWLLLLAALSGRLFGRSAPLPLDAAIPSEAGVAIE